MCEKEINEMENEKQKKEEEHIGECVALNVNWLMFVYKRKTQMMNV